VLSSTDVRNASSPDAQAVKLLAQYGKSGGDEKAKEAAVALAKKEPENASVLVCCGTVLAGSGAYQEAVEVLGRHQGSLDA
jgi:coatomer protein complex subunit epsilon